MNKKAVCLILIIGLILSQFGCTGFGKNSAERIPKQKETKLQPLTEQDFHINYAGVDLTVGINPDPIITKLEKATFCGTKRGSNQGDTLKEVEDLYGPPTEKAVSAIENKSYYYQLKDKTLEFTTAKYEESVSSIILKYNK